jgi:hypothetical protein
MVTMLSPQGETGTVPQSKVADAIKAGGKTGTWMTAPDGSQGVIPHDQVDAALKAGGKLVPPDQTPDAVAARHALTRQGKTFTPPGVIDNLGEGFVRSAGATGQGIGRLYAATGAPVPHYLSNDKGTGLFDGGETEQEGVAMHIGGLAENIFEFMAGDEAVKGLSFAEKLGYAQKIANMAKSSPRIARMLNIGMNSMRVGAVGAVQGTLQAEGSGTNEKSLVPDSTAAAPPTPGQAAESGAITGGITAATAGTIEAVAPFAKTVMGKLFDKLGLADRITKAETGIAAHQGEIDEVSQLGKAAAEKGQSIPFHDEFGQPGDAEKAIAAAKTGAPSPLSEGLRGQALVKGVQGDLDAVQAKLGTDYGAKLDEFSQQATAKGIMVGGQDSAIAQKAQEIIGKGSTLPSGIQDALKGSVPLMEKVQPILEELAKGEPMSWSQAVELQKTLGNKAYSITDFGDPTKRVFSDLKAAVGQSLEDAATKGGAPDIAKGLSDMRTDYGVTIGKLQDNSVISALRNKDLDGVAKLLMSRDTVGDNVQTLRGLLARVGSTNMAGVESEMYEQLLNKSSDFTSGTRNLDFDKFTANFFKIPEEVRAQIWGSKIDDVAADLKFAAEVRTGDAGPGDSLATKTAQLDAMKARLQKLQTPGSQLLSGLLRHGPAGVPALKAVKDFVYGDYDKLPADIGEIVALEGGTYALKNPTIQKSILALLTYAGDGGNRNPLGAADKLGADAADVAGEPSLRNVRGANSPADFNVGLGGMGGGSADRPRGNL